MDLFDFFMPEQAQASHLRRIANHISRPNRSLQKLDQAEDMQALRDDVQFLTMIIAALLRRLSETETASLADVQDLMEEIDGLDGVPDGGLNPGVLRGLLGVLKQSSEDQTDRSENGEEFKIETTPRYRR